MTSMEDKEAYYGIDTLPDELLIYIFKLLPIEDLVVCEEVSHRWRKLALDSAVWRRLIVLYSGKPGQSEVSNQNLEIISSHSKYIHCLKLQYVYSYPILKAIINRCTNITSLELIMCRIGKDIEKDFIRWPNLKKLSLKNSLLLVPDDLNIPFDKFKDFNYLSLSDFGLSSLNSDALLRCKNLSHIYIEKIRDLRVEYITELILSKKNILETLHIYGGDSVNDQCLHLLAKCPALKDLAIIRCEGLTDEGLAALVDLKKIRHLQIWNNTIFTELKLLRVLSSPNLIQLKSLSLSRIRNISPIIVDVISEYYKDLKFLAVYQCPRIINTDYEKQLKSKFRNIDVVLY